MRILIVKIIIFFKKLMIKIKNIKYHKYKI